MGTPLCEAATVLLVELDAVTHTLCRVHGEEVEAAAIQAGLPFEVLDDSDDLDPMCEWELVRAFVDQVWRERSVASALARLDGANAELASRALAGHRDALVELIRDAAG